MELKLYDTLTREKRVFAPIDPAHVRMYVCGPTVYDFAHIGNARPVIVFDVLFRLLRHLYGAEHVTYVRNITDVDDKINARAAERGVPIREVTEADLQGLQRGRDGARLPAADGRAARHRAHRGDEGARSSGWCKNGCAYVAEDHVLFNVASMPDYGKLSKRSLDEMIAGARVEVAPYKETPMDFVLWKPSKPGEPAWPSPCGIATPGRPGWHIECSAMAWKHLGRDLRHPRRRHRSRLSAPRERDRAVALRLPHAGDGELLDAQRLPAGGRREDVEEPRQLRDHPRTADRTGRARWLRLNMLRTHYRQPIDWTVKRISRKAARCWTAGTTLSALKRIRASVPDAEFVDALC